MSGPKAIRLVELDAEIEPVELPSGRIVKVRAVDGAAMQIVREFKETGDELLLWKIAALVLPEATEEEVNKLSFKMVEAVMALATHQADKVETMLGNGLRPGVTVRRSGSRTRSRTPSASSRAASTSPPTSSVGGPGT